MVRLFGVDLPRDKKISVALTYIYGIGLTTSKTILDSVNIDSNIQCKNLNNEQLNNIRDIITNHYEIEGDLRRLHANYVRRLMEINCYRGKRHKLNLPLRGQRTRTNARTKRGMKKTITGRKKAPKK